MIPQRPGQLTCVEAAERLDVLSRGGKLHRHKPDVDMHVEPDDPHYVIEVVLVDVHQLAISERRIILADGEIAEHKQA